MRIRSSVAEYRWIVCSTIFVLISFALLAAVYRSDFHALYAAGRAEGESALACIWAFLETDFAADFDERIFTTIAVGDAKETVISKLGQPRYSMPNPEWWRRKGELLVYANTPYDKEGIAFFIRCVEVDPSGKVANLKSEVYWD
ncbi:MAG: hypothetical protein HUU46_17485 [Candidatus Hydrogenedentes bacterium]|nr:hypothetical protein [Candidatus Hydrogenedentota bacterium]